MIIEKNYHIYNLTVTKGEAVELIKKLAERLGTQHASDVFNMPVSDISGDEHYPAVLRVEVVFAGAE